MDRQDRLSQATKRQKKIDAIIKDMKRLDEEKLQSISIHLRKHQFLNKPNNSEELWHCVKATFGINIPYTSTDERMNAPFEWFSDLYFGRTPISVAVANRGGAKAIWVDTPLLTAHGWKTIGTVVIGDSVFGIDGRPYPITDVSEFFINNDCYKVSFSDGTSIIADADHRWEVGINSIYSNCIKTTKELSNTVNVLDSEDVYTYYLPKYRPLKTGEYRPDIDLYSLVTKIKNFPNKEWSLESVKALHPHERIQFVAELFNDGRDYSPHSDLPYYFFTTVEGMADDIVELCYLSGCSGIRKVAMKGGFELVFDLKDNKRFITGVEKVPSVATRCISVDAPRNLYLAGKSLVPTHNTYSSAMLNVLWGTHYPGSWSIHAAGTRDQSKVMSRYLFNMSRDPVITDVFDRGRTLKLSATFKNGSEWYVTTGTMEGVSGNHPNILTLDEIEFWERDAIEQSMAVPVVREGAPKILAMYSTRQRSFGSMNWLVDEAPKRGFKIYMWSIFETMKRCQSCIAIDQHPHGTDKERMSACNLWDDCYGKRGTKASGWVDLKTVQEFKASLGGSGSREWETQGLCIRPSSHGLVMHNFEHKMKPEGNYCDWEYRPELPLYVSHDPAEGKKSVMYFIQLYEDDIYIFDEIVQNQCSDPTESKEALYNYIIEKGWEFPEVVVVDPRRTDAVAIWRKGEPTGTGMYCKFNAHAPLQDEEHGGQRIEMGVDYVRRLIKQGDGKRRLFINPKNCPSAVQGMREYHYPMDKNTNSIQGGDKPDKEWSDEVDPIRYFCQYYTFTLRRGQKKQIRFFGSL